MLGLWYRRITGIFSIAAFEVLSLFKPLSYWTFAASYVGSPPVPPPPVGLPGARIGELPKGHSRFSFGAFTKIISRRRFR